MITAKQLVQFAIKAKDDGVVYWYGTYWNVCSVSLYNAKKKQYPKHYTSGRAAGYKKDIADGRMCTDCIGLLKGAAWSECGAHAAKYGTNGCPDKSADGMLAYAKSKGCPNGKISTMPEIPGIMLHKSGHVGVYIGGGKAIEAQGFDYDTKETSVASRGWTEWTQLPFVDYSDSAEVPVDEPEFGDKQLQKGNKGEHVTKLQTLLKGLGYSLGTYGAQKDGIDGDYGSKTQAAVKAFQKSNRLVVTGVADIATIAAIIAAAGATDEPEEPDDDTNPDVEHKYIIDCLDLSSHNSANEPKIDWQKIKDGVGFLVLRCGCTRVKTSPLGVGADSYFEKWAAKCVEHGIPFGAYYYSHAKNVAQAEAEAEFTYSIAAKYNPVFYAMDCEESSLTDKRINAWVAKMRELGAKRIALYVAHNLYASYDLDKDEDGFIAISDADWVPRYGKNDGTFNKKYIPKWKCDLWQGTSVFKFDGIPDKTLDANVVTGQRRSLKWFRGEE